MEDLYKKYSLEDFLADDRFIDWVIHGTHQEKWDSWLSNNQEIAERVEEARKLTKNIRFKQDNVSPRLKSDLWDRIDKNTQAKEVAFPLKRWLPYIGAAASLALIAFFFFNPSSEKISTAVAEYQEIELPSSSIIEVGPSSEVSYNERNWESKRDVELEGTAHFKVSKGVPFTVKTEFGQVQVLGTEFDVFAQNGSFNVKVEEGKVQVTSGRHEEILTADMSFLLNPMTKQLGSLEEWKTSMTMIVFEKHPLSDVIEALSIVTDKKVDASAIEMDQLYTGTFDTTESLDQILKQVFWPLQITYKISDDAIVLN